MKHLTQALLGIQKFISGMVLPSQNYSSEKQETRLSSHLITLNYIIFNLLAVSACQCLCRVRCLCPYMCFIDNNYFRLVGTGESISLWNDSWCGDPLFITLNLPQNANQHLSLTTVIQGC